MSEKKGDNDAAPTEDVSTSSLVHPPKTAHPSTGTACLGTCGWVLAFILIAFVICPMKIGDTGRSITSDNVISTKDAHNEELYDFVRDLKHQFNKNSGHWPMHPGNARNGERCGRQKHHDLNRIANAPQDQAPVPPTTPHDICVASALKSSPLFRFPISAEEYHKIAFYLGHGFSASNEVIVRKSTHRGTDITVDINVYYDDENLKDDIALSAFRHNDTFVVEVHRNQSPYRHRANGTFPSEQCLILVVDITFPAEVEAFDSLDIKSASAAVSGSLPGVLLDSFQVGVGNGSIKFTDIIAKEITLGILDGSITGVYTPTQKILSGAVRGFIDETLTIKDMPVSITARTTDGPIAVSIPSKEYQGEFHVHSTNDESATVLAPNPHDIHAEVYTAHYKAGYYKTAGTGANIFIRAKNGWTRLTFD